MTEISLNFALVLVSSACIGGFIGAFIAYKKMYKAWRIDRDNFFDKLEKKNGLK